MLEVQVDSRNLDPRPESWADKIIYDEPVSEH